jgi:DNA-damage-inducible protein J
MNSVNVTVRIDEETKREFDIFCANVGMNITTAFNMFIKATLRTRELPFSVTDIEPIKRSREAVLARGIEAFREAQEQAITNGTSEMSLNEINEIIAEVRQESRENQ